MQAPGLLLLVAEDIRYPTPIDDFLGQPGRKHQGREWKKHIQKKDPCSFCGGIGGTRDHVRPRSKGGSSKWENLAGACARCNGSKTDKELLLYLLWRLDRPISDAIRREVGLLIKKNKDRLEK